MNKLTQELIKDLLPEDWWTDMSGDAQKQYLSTHPKSPKAVDTQNPSGKKERETGIGVKHNVKPWSDENYKEESKEVKQNLPDFQNKSEEEAEKALRDTDRVKSRQLEPNEIKNMSNSEAGLAQEYMNDDSGKSDEFGDTDKEEKVKNLINYQNFEDEGQRWEYTQKAKDEFGEENLPRYDDSKGDEAYDDPKNHESYKKFKKIKDNSEYVKKYGGGEAGGKWRNIDGLIDAFKQGSSIPSNLVAQDKEGNTQLVGGNTRFVAAIGAGVNPITKVMNVDNVVKNESINEAPRVPRKKGQHRGSKSHSDLYTDENPKGTIKGLKFATVKDAKASVSKIKRSGRSHAHKIQAAVAMEQRAREMGKTSQAAVYRKYINQMKKKTKKKNEMIGGLPSPSRKLVKKMKRQGHTSVPYGSGYEKVEEGIILEYSKFKLRIPSDIKNIHKLFKKNKKKLFVVGGAVRDAILGKNPKDFDLATDAKPDEVLKIAKKGGLKTVEVGKQFGVVIVGGHEIATFRKDIGKGRRPSSVDYTDIEGDVKRRDLTINALFYDLDRGEIVDLVGGIEDLKRKKIRTVGKPVERFDEDPLRKMRALRFQGALGGKLGRETENALRQNPSLKGVSKERIRDEFVKSIKKAKSPKKYLQLADELGFTKQILPKFQVSIPYINENDYILFLAWILRKNDVNSIRKLNGLAYPNQDIVNIQFLNVLQSFRPENIFLIKKFQEKTTLSDKQIIRWGKYIKKDFKKLVRFKLSVKGSDVSKDLKGKEIGKAIQNMEKDNYLNEIAVRKKPKKFKDIYNALPIDLKKRVYNLKNYDQRRDFHPEGNVLKHTIAVTNRALRTGDIDFALAALFHDIGKDSTAKLHPKKGFWTHYGHEKVSAKIVLKYKKWIKSMGGNVADIYYIVSQHTRMKVFDKMKWQKQDKLSKFRAFPKLKKFSKSMDIGGRGINDSVNEGINDPGILKAVFLAGGPGSGKSFVASGLYGIPKKVNVSAFGLKLINQDKELTRMLNKYGFGTDLDDMPDELFKQLTDPTYDDYSGLRGRAKELTASRKKLYMDGRLGMIIDGTGHKYDKIKKQKEELEEIGYDCYMVFVHTDLDIAQKRNMERPRKLNPEIVERSWNEVQKNKIYFQGLFGNENFMMVDNSNTLSEKQAAKKFNMLVKKGIGKFIRKPVKNYRGKNWIKKQKILKESTLNEQKIKKVVGIYGGRYQPFGPHHFKTYKWLKSKVDDAYITTSNIKKPPRHPMNFSEKVRHMVKMGVPKNRIIKAASPLKAEEVLKKYDPKTTAVIYIFGEKDAGRLSGGKKKDGSPSYFQDYNKNKRNLKGYEEHGYFMVAPHQSVKVGGKEVSGTVMRDLLGSPKIEDKDRPKLFKQAFGYFDKGVYNMMTNKFRKLYETFDKFLQEKDISEIIKESSAIGNSIPSISDEGLYDFFQNFDDYHRISKRWAEQHGWELVNYVLSDSAQDPKPKGLSFDSLDDQMVKTVTYGKTINQGGKNWQSVDEPYGKYAQRQAEINQSIGWELVKFMMNPKQDVKVDDTWKIDQLDVVDSDKLSNLATEKDNELLSEGKLIAARNKGHLKNKGETALDINAMKSKFAGRGDIADAFVFAMKDLQKAISSLSEKQRDKIFMNGKAFMNLEVMWPKSANVIDYDKAEIIFHGALEYDDDGNVVGQVKDSGRILAGMIQQVNQNVQKNYNIGKPQFLSVPKVQDFGKKKKQYLSRLTKLQRKFKLKDNDTLALYHQRWWEDFITKNAKKYKVKMKPRQLQNLVKRWAFMNKSYSVPQIRTDYKDNPKFLDWILKYDKNNHQAQMKENMKPFEILFFDVGAEIMKNVSGWIAASPERAVQGIKTRLDAAIKDVQSKKDLKKLNKLKIQLDRLNSIGGLDAIVPSEGIVFKYKGKTYKFTGAFAPINQITGLMTF